MKSKTLELLVFKDRIESRWEGENRIISIEQYDGTAEDQSRAYEAMKKSHPEAVCYRTKFQTPLF